MTRCPACRHELDAATNRHDATPKEGDLSLCVECGTILVYNRELRLRMAQEADWQDLMKEDMDELQRMAAAIRAVRPPATA